MLRVSKSVVDREGESKGGWRREGGEVRDGREGRKEGEGEGGKVF